MVSNDASGGIGEECAPEGTPGTALLANVFPLFDPQKRKEMMQQKAFTKPKKPRGRAASPISLSDTETTDTKPRRSRSKPTVVITKGAKSKRRLKEDPDGDFGASKASRAKKDSTSTTHSSPLLTPTSSPVELENIGDAGYFIDPNRSRRKRRKKTPVPTQGEVDEPPPPSWLEGTQDTQSETFYESVTRPLAIRESPSFSVEVPVRQPPPEPLKPDAFKVLMTKKKKEEEPIVIEDEVPILPSYSLEDIPDEAPSGKRTPVTYNPDTGILIIRSSPILLPSSPPLVATLSSKSKKKRERKKKRKEELVEISLPEAIGDITAGKRTTAKFDSGTGILTIRSSPILAPHSPKLPPVSAFSLLGKKKEILPRPAATIQVPPPAAQAEVSLPTVTIRQAPKKVAVSQPNKIVHPFFQPGGLKKILDPTPLPIQPDTEEDLSITSTRAVSQSTSNRNPLLGQTLVTSGSGSLFSGSNGCLSPTTNRILKSPGLWDVPWPNKGNCHCRDLLTSPVEAVMKVDGRLLLAERKLKDLAVAVSGEEDLLLQYARKLPIRQLEQKVNALDYDERRYYDVPSDVRLPERIVTTGTQLQDMVRKQVSARLPHPNASSKATTDSSDDDVPAVRRKTHPALIKLYTRLKHELTPFDKSECETSSWEVKYAPESSHEVLQIGKETQILKDWLMALKVESVGPSTNKKSSKRKSRNSTPSGSGGKGNIANKKRKKKKEAELSDFIVDSEEERDEMNEITDPEDNDGTPGLLGVKKSTIRAGDRGIESPFGGPKEPARLVNAVVISGPNGCGKTAAVYAVAKEAGFTVFEVSPGMRRNGKDIIDQVGEMSKTHLVHQAKAASSTALDGAKSFFKPKQMQKLQGEEIVPKATTSQQQSLILLEEVDLLFEEDKQFWSSVLTLMAQSKRPIVFTCNDENLLPIDTLPLHAILRFTQPPKELVVDQLLLMCANEGHLLQRDSVESLVVSHNGDMRASLVELEFWCRMGLGDRKGGLDWMILRWPVGIDTTESGEKLRVVSKDTYIKGMGNFDRTSMDEEMKWRSIWETWEVDVGGEGSGIGKLRELGDETSKRGMNRIEALRVCDEYAEAMSAVDAYAGGCMRGFDEMSMDSTQPLLSCKVRVDDTQGYQILQTDPLVKTYSIETEMAVSVRSLARRHLYGKRYKEFRDEELVDFIAQRSKVKQELKPLPQNYLSETFRCFSHTSTIFASTPAVCHSSVNGPPSVLMLDVAPYVRHITRSDTSREQGRIKASNLLSVGGEGKSMSRRATRTARRAEEGGDRSKKEKWFPANVNTILVEGSGGVGWGELNVKWGEDSDSDEDGEYELE